MQQIFGVQVVLYLPQHNKAYKINAFYAVVFLFLLVTWLKRPIKAFNVTYGNCSE